MRYGSVCSGIEAATVAWDYLGWEPVFFSEIAPFQCSVLVTRFPEVPNLGDMTQITSNNGKEINGPNGIICGGIELLVGGTPCQGFSIQGLKKGMQDERSALCLHFTRLLRELKPAWCVWENVPGVISSGGGRTSGNSSTKLLNAGIAAHGECWTLAMCEWTASLAPFLKEDGVYSLSDILERTSDIPQKYYLRTPQLNFIIRHVSKSHSERALQGIFSSLQLPGN